MKKLLIFSILAAAAFTSCDDYLDCQPEHKFGSESFLANEAELQLYSYGFIQNNVPDIYTVAASIQRFNQVASWGGDEHSDLGFTRNKWNCLDATMFGCRSQGGWGTGNWGALRAINYFLDHMVNAKGNVEDKIYKHYEGVGRFWRAWFYFDMVQEFENVPWYGTEVKSDDLDALYKTQDSRKYVMERVLEDISFAAENCSADSKYLKSRTMVNQAVAMAMKARICLFEGTYRKYHTELGLSDADQWLTEAANAAKALIGAGFSLEADYASLFLKSSLANKETIFGVAYDTELRKHEVTWRWLSPTYGSNWSMPYPFICTYLMKDGSRYTDQPGYETKEYRDVFTNRDNRLAATVVSPTFKKKVNGVDTQIPPQMTVTLNGFQPIKWVLREGGSYESQGISYNSAPLIRYAEVLLIYAEAKAELGQMTPDVWNSTIKLLRERAGVNGDMPTSADPYMQQYFLNRCTDKYILEVRRERGCELAWEGLRYQDILRWKVGELLTPQNGWAGIYIPKINELYDLNGDGVNDLCVYDGEKPSADNNAVYIKVDASRKLSEGDHGYLMYGCNFNLKWQDFMYVRPVPTTAIQNNPNLVQRDGWADL